jgi:hypothetical protein
VQVPGRGKKEVQAVKGRLLSRGAYVCLGILSGNLWSMHAHKTTVTVLAGHEVVVRLPDDFPPGEADVIVMPHATVASGRESGADFDRFLASLPTAPVVSLDSLDRGDLYR